MWSNIDNKKCIFILLIILGFILRIDVYSSNKKIKQDSNKNNVVEKDQSLKYSTYDFKD